MSLVVDGWIHQNGLDANSLLVAVGLAGSGVVYSGGALRIGGASIAAQLHGRSKTHGYLIGGLGIVNRSIGDLTATVGASSATASAGILSSTAIMVLGGVGVNIDTKSPVMIFIESRYSIGLTEGKAMHWLPITAGVKIQLSR